MENRPDQDQKRKVEQLKHVTDQLDPGKDQIIIIGPDRMRVVETPEYGEITVVLHDGKATFVDSKKREKI